MTSIRCVDDERSAGLLAELLNGDSRAKPIVVVTIAAGRESPWIDVEEVSREVGSLADIYLMRTGDATWEFSRRMVAGSQVYGGAGRVYPVGHDWSSDLSKSPLRFAFDVKDGERATKQIISDTLRMAAGLLQKLTPQTLRPASGSVTGVIAGRALIDVGNSLPAVVAEELTMADVPIERILVSGQEVDGRYDAEMNRMDLTKSLRPSAEALACYAVGDVVLTKVAMVRKGKAELVLYPKTTAPGIAVLVLRSDITTNPLDDLRTLMTVGEVIRARIVATAPEWQLVLNDIDDDECVVEAPPLLAGGPPWIIEEPEVTFSAEPQPLILPSPLRSSPALLDRTSPSPTQSTPEHQEQLVSSAPPTESTKKLLLKIDGLRAEVGSLKRELESLRIQLIAGTDEREQLRYLLGQSERRANRAEHDLKAARARLRKSGTSKASPAHSGGPKFADPEQGFRYLVVTRWATRTILSEQRARPLPDYIIGPRFLDSLGRLEGIKEEKVADVVFEIVTGLAPQIPGREVHHLRAGVGGEAPITTRGDGSVAWRASLQVKTPSARRIHYWILPDGTIELGRVTTHDVFDA